MANPTPKSPDRAQGGAGASEPSLVRPDLRPGQVREPNFRDLDSNAHNPFEVGRFDYKRGKSEDDNPYPHDPHERMSGHWYHEHWIMGFEAAQHEAEEPDVAPAHRAPALGAAGPADAVAGDPLADLVSHFSAALLDKLRRAEAKYSHGNAWMRDDWRDGLCRQLVDHVAKGDPLDVAAYTAFAWHHGWSTAGAPRLTLNEWASKSHRDQAKWWMDPATREPIQRNDGELLMLMVSEIAEAMEGIRKNLMDDKLPHRRMVEVEMADLFIRMMDFAGARGLDLDGSVAEKTAFNATRKDHTFEARLAAGGKRF